MKAVKAPHRLRAAVAAAALAPILASCGFDYATDQIYVPGEGVNDRSSDVDVLHALVVSGDDGSGTVIAGLVNNDLQEADRLVEVSGAGGSSDVEVTIDGEVEVPADGLVQLAEDGQVTIEGDAVQAGRFVTLRFTFENADPVELDVPVVPNTGDYADVPVPQEGPSPTEGTPGPGDPSPGVLEDDAEEDGAGDGAEGTVGEVPTTVPTEQ